MVEWKGEIGEESGKKARLLDSLGDEFNVPNFFVITSDEIRRLFGEESDPERILNSSLNRSIKREIKDAYEEVGMSSAVREASGRAKSLVGGQRSSQLVSVRISGSGKEKYTYKLNVGSSSLFESIREVVSSYSEENSGHPSVIIQKMVEPGHTGALEISGREMIVETVNGLGISLEEGITQPHTYHLRNSQVQNVMIAEEQLEISRNPVRGENQRQKIKNDEQPFDNEKIEDLAQKASMENLNLKFVYKRGGFHITDAYEASNQSEGFIVSEKGVRVSRGEISGRIGSRVVFSDQTMPPEEYPEALIAKKGGYSSRDGYRARKSGKPAIFGFKEELKNGQQIKLGSAEIEVTNKQNLSTKRDSQTDRSVSRNETRTERRQTNTFKNERSAEHIDSKIVASEVLPIDPRSGEGICLNRNSDQGYVVSNRRTNAERIPESGYLSSFEDVFAFNGDKLVLDARRINDRGLGNALNYLEADLKILLLQNIDREKVKVAVEAGFDVFGAPEDSLEEMETAVAREEKRFIMEKLREL